MNRGVCSQRQTRASLVRMVDSLREMRLDTVSSTFSAGSLEKKVSIPRGSSCDDITAYAACRACGVGHDSRRWLARQVGR